MFSRSESGSSLRHHRVRAVQFEPYKQCSGMGSVSFWASRIWICQRYGSGSGSSHHQAKKSKKTLDFYCCDFFMTYFFLPMMNDVLYLQKVVSQKTLHKKTIFCLHLVDHCRKEHEPDPLVRGKESRIRIHTKMSRIRNTV